VPAFDASYVPRLVDLGLDALAAQLPAVMVTGPRAAGKTTTLARRAATVVRLDVPAQAAAFEADPDAALRGLAEPVLLDEWQAVPSVLGAVRRAVESEPAGNRFLLSGSVRAELDHGVWAATGRIVRLSMFGMTLREQGGRTEGPSVWDRLAAGDDLPVPADTPDLRGYVELALRGGFPAAALRLTGLAHQAWMESYLENLLTRDVSAAAGETTRRRDPVRLRRYFEACALNSAADAEHKTIYEAAGINRLTALDYDDLLTRLYVVDALPAWENNRLKRLTRTAKRYIAEPALIAAALRLDVAGVLGDGNLLGRLLDSFVAAQLRPEATVSASRPRLYHLRTQSAREEVDIVAEFGGGRVIGVEVKADAAPGRRAARHLAWLRDRLGDRFVAGVVLHTGPRLFTLEERIVAAPISSIWG
jgi:predicted AAA+ superfamily ATPase